MEHVHKVLFQEQCLRMKIAQVKDAMIKKVHVENFGNTKARNCE